MSLDLFTLQSIIQGLKILIDFIIVWVLIYYTLRVVRNNSRTVQIFKGVVLIVLVRFIAYYFDLKVVLALADFLIQYGVLVFVIIFQPELRGLLERLGKSTVFSSLHTLSGNERERLIDELVSASVDLSSKRIGAIISLEQGHSLADFIKTGTPINSSVSADLLTSIFVTTTPLHDGAVIIQGDRIACASAYFPTTALDLPTRYGARHRAALGISEITDSVTLVISEETGQISVAENGKLTEMDEASLREFLNVLIQNAEKEVSNRIEFKTTRRMNLGRLNVDPIRIEKVDEGDKPKQTFKKRREVKQDESKDNEGLKEKKRPKLFKKMKQEKAHQETKDKKTGEGLEALKAATSRHKSEDNNQQSDTTSDSMSSNHNALKTEANETGGDNDGETR